jgi:hypothetical protein
LQRVATARFRSLPRRKYKEPNDLTPFNSNNSKSWFLAGVLTLALVIPSWASAEEFKRIVVFDGSVSNPGNLFALI